MPEGLVFNPPPGWPAPPRGWRPPPGWTPDPAWPAPPPGWQLWIGAGVREDGDPEDDQGSRSPVDPACLARPTTPDANGSNARVALLEAEVEALRAQLAVQEGAGHLAILSDERVLQEVGIYRYHHPLESAVAYRDRLAKLSERIALAVKLDEAITCSNLFTYDNSLAKGRKMTRDFGRLMLRAYNAEVENCLRTMRVGNVETAKKRIGASCDIIARLGAMMEMRISNSYHGLRIEEVELTADFLMKKQEERELAREEQARLREERRVEAELATERERLDKERAHLANALAAVRESGQSAPELEERLTAVDAAIVQNDFRAANIRAGYVYVISNPGAFGRNVVKIGLTRRLEPSERVTELGGASVPFGFDVHCLFFSENAVSLEGELHQHFADRRLNCANPRKEFFFASPAEVRDVLESKLGNLLEFNEKADATEYYQSLSRWPIGRRAASEAMQPPRE